MDLSSVNWDNVDYGHGKPEAPKDSPAPAPPASQPEQPAYNTPETPKTTPQAEAPKPAPTSSEAPKASPTPSTGSGSGSNSGSGSGSHSGIGGILDGLLHGIDDFASKLGAKVGVNSESENGQIWIGGDSKYSATFTNAADKDAMIWCWGKSTMWINANVPLISVKLGPGETQKLSIAEGFSGGCGASLPDSNLFMGLLNESILEFTTGAGAMGCFDVSREINMKGVHMTAKGSKCTSGYDNGKMACTFICTQPGVDRCGAGGGDYAIEVGTSSDGPCMVGKDPFTGDAAGGCQMGDDGEHMEVTIGGSRQW